MPRRLSEQRLLRLGRLAQGLFHPGQAVDDLGREGGVGQQFHGDGSDHAGSLS